jgi:5-amino-6-(5-phospho-D-ribitylamino)uracil phosphatase
LQSLYNAPVPIRLIALDLDGTLLDSRGLVSLENAAAVAEAAARGIEIVIVTGRRFDFARPAIDALTSDFNMIVSNGAVIKSKSGSTIYRRLLPAATARRLLRATVAYRSGVSVIFDRPREKQVILECVDWDHPVRGPYLRRNREFIAEISPLEDCLNGEDPIQIGYAGPCASARALMSLLESLPFSAEFSLALTEYLPRDLSILDLLGPTVSKGATLTEWARRRGISRNAIMAIGDNWNDREMLAAAGLPVVMGNAVPELQALGYAVTCSNEESGVAAAIRKYALNPAGAPES